MSDYIALSELKTFLGYSGSGQDDNLNMAIDAASRAIDSYCGRFFHQTSLQTRYYDCEFPDFADVDDISTTTGLVVKSLQADGTVDTTYTLNTDYYLYPLNAANETPAMPFNKIVMAISNSGELLPTGHRKSLSVYAKFGFSAVPEAVKQAAAIQSSRYWQRRHSTMGFSGNPETAEAPVIFLSELDPDVQNLIKHFRVNKTTLASGRPFVSATTNNYN
jgi:hypothetical protein